MKSLFAVAVPSLMIAGLVLDYTFLNNVAIAFVWFTAMFGFFAAAVTMSDEIGADLRKTLRDRPTWRKWWGRAADVPIVLLLAGNGYWWAFGFFTIQALLSYGAEECADKETENE